MNIIVYAVGIILHSFHREAEEKLAFYGLIQYIRKLPATDF